MVWGIGIANELKLGRINAFKKKKELIIKLVSFFFSLMCYFQQIIGQSSWSVSQLLLKKTKLFAVWSFCYPEMLIPTWWTGEVPKGL